MVAGQVRRWLKACFAWMSPRMVWMPSIRPPGVRIEGSYKRCATPKRGLFRAFMRNRRRTVPLRMYSQSPAALLPEWHLRRSAGARPTSDAPAACRDSLPGSPLPMKEPPPAGRPSPGARRGAIRRGRAPLAAGRFPALADHRPPRARPALRRPPRRHRASRRSHAMPPDRAPERRRIPVGVLDASSVVRRLRTAGNPGPGGGTG